MMAKPVQSTIRAHKIRLNPTTEQEIYFRKAAGTKRFVYNWALDRWKWAKEQGMPLYGIANKRADAHHKASHAIASTYAFIGVEDLHVKGMIKNRRLSLVVSDVGLGEFIRQIEYKSEAFGGVVVKVGRFFASSKTCSDCGYINGQLTLSDRKWTCTDCGVIHQRDWNAAINIEHEALRIHA